MDMVYFPLVLAIVTALPGSGKLESSQPDPLCLHPSRLYPDVDDCRKFIRCVNRKPVSFSCPPKTAFDPETQICGWRFDMNECFLQHSTAVTGTKSLFSDSKKVLLVNKETLGKTLSSDIWSKVTKASMDFKNIVPVNEKITEFSDDETEDTDNGNHKKNFTNISNSAAKNQINFANGNPVNKGKFESKTVVVKPTTMLPVTISNKPLISIGNDNLLPTVKKDSTTFSNLIQSLGPSQQKYVPNIYLQQTQPQVTLFKQVTTEATDVGRSPNGSNVIVVSTIQMNTKDAENQLGFSPTWLTSNYDSKSALPEFTNTVDRKISPTETAEKNDVPTTNDPDLFKANSAGKPSAYDSDSGHIKTTQSSRNEEAEKTSYSATFIEFKDSSVRAEITDSEHITGRDSSNSDNQVNIHSLNRPENISTPKISNVTEDNVEDIPEDVNTHAQTSYQNDKNIEINSENVVMARQHLPRAQSFDHTPVSFEENTQSREFYNNQTSTDQQVPPTRSPNSNGNSYNKEVTLASDNVHELPGSTASLSENISKSTPLNTTKDEDIGLPLYNQNPGFDEDNNERSIATDDESEITPVTHRRDHIDVDLVDFLVALPDDNTETLPKFTNKTVDFQVKDERGQSLASVMNQSQISDFYRTSFSSNSSSATLTDTEETADVAQKYDLNTLLTTIAPTQTEEKFNTSFMSVPYMIRGLVRPFRCPEPDGHFVDPKNCSVYYHCTGGQPYRRDCPAGQVFYLAVLSCVSSSLAPPCPNMDNVLEEETVVELAISCKQDGYFRDPKQCNVYYICAGGSSMRMTCDPGTSFDVTHNLCLWNDQVRDCNATDVISPSKRREDTLAAKKKNLYKFDASRQGSDFYQKDYSCPEKNGVFPDADNCSNYYICNDGLAKYMLCPYGTGYDDVSGACVESTLVSRCNVGNGYDDTKSHDSVSNLQTVPFACPDAHGLYPDPNNCSIFIHCFKRVPYRHMCQPDTVFSADIGVCTWRELVPECQKEGKLGLGETQLKNAVASLDQQSQQDIVASEPYQQHLSYFESPVSEIQDQPVELQDFTCPEVADGFFRDNMFCDIFHRCVFGTRFTFTCPTGTFFRLRGNLCDFWETVTDCTEDGLRLEAMRSLPEIAKLPVLPPVVSDFDLSIVNLDADPVPCPESSGLFAHPRSCRQFLFCSQFLPLVLTCPESLLYNPQTLTCDLAKNVQCLRYDDFGKI